MHHDYLLRLSAGQLYVPTIWAVNTCRPPMKSMAKNHNFIAQQAATIVLLIVHIYMFPVDANLDLMHMQKSWGDL